MLGNWTIRPAHCVISNRFSGDETKITPKSMEVLLFLAKRTGDVVSADEILDVVWESSFVGANAVQKCVAEIRRATQDDARNPSILKTVSKRGYQLISVPTPIDAEESADFSIGGLVVGEKKRLPKAAWWLATAGASIAIAVVLLLALPPIPKATIVHFRDSSFIVTPPDEIPDQEQASRYKDLSQALLTKFVTTGDAQIEETADPRRYSSDSNLGVLTFKITNNELLASFERGTTPMLFERFPWTPGMNVGQVVSHLFHDLAMLSAQDNWAQIVKSGTRDVHAYQSFVEGMTYFKYRDAENFRLAGRAFRKALDHDPGFANAYRALGWTYHHLFPISRDASEREQIRQDWHTLIDLARQNIGTTAHEIEMFLSITLSDHANALQNVNEVLRKDPDNIDALIELAELLIGKGLVHEARKYLERAAELGVDPEDSAWISLADTAGDMQEYFRLAKKALEKQPNYTVTSFGLAIRSAQIGRVDDVSEYVHRLETSDPTGTWAYTAKVTADVILGRLTPTGDEFERRMADQRLSKLSRGRIYFMLGDVEKGVEDWAQVEPQLRFFLVQFLAMFESFHADNVVSDPKYQALLDRFNLGSNWRHMLLQSAHDLADATGIVPDTQVDVPEIFSIANPGSSEI